MKEFNVYDYDFKIYSPIKLTDELDQAYGKIQDDALKAFEIVEDTNLAHSKV